VMAATLFRIAGRVGLIVGGSVMLVACGTPTGSPAAGRPANGFVAGRVTAGPTCPVERIGHPCPPRAVVAEVEARAAGRVVASTRSRTDGTYRLELRGGTYTVVAVTQNMIPRCADRTVTVAATHTTSADITCDTGIR
jgi:hypothetical protein